MAEIKDTTRRGTMLAVLGLTAAVLPVAAMSAANPDAALIAACDAYSGLMNVVNHGKCGDYDSKHPAWVAFYACQDTINDGEPQTMAGVLAMCRAIQAEALGLNGEPISYDGTSAGKWAQTVVDTLLWLNGGAA